MACFDEEDWRVWAADPPLPECNNPHPWSDEERMILAKLCMQGRYTVRSMRAVRDHDEQVARLLDGRSESSIRAQMASHPFSVWCAEHGYKLPLQAIREISRAVVTGRAVRQSSAAFASPSSTPSLSMPPSLIPGSLSLPLPPGALEGNVPSSERTLDPFQDIQTISVSKPFSIRLNASKLGPGVILLVRYFACAEESKDLAAPTFETDVFNPSLIRVAVPHATPSAEEILQIAEWTGLESLSNQVSIIDSTPLVYTFVMESDLSPMLMRNIELDNMKGVFIPKLSGRVRI